MQKHKIPERISIAKTAPNIMPEVFNIFLNFFLFLHQHNKYQTHQQAACKAGNMLPGSSLSHKHSAYCIDSQNYQRQWWHGRKENRSVFDCKYNKYCNQAVNSR